MREKEAQAKLLNPHAEHADHNSLLDLLEVGWWEADTKEGSFICSPLVANLLGLQTDTIDINSFFKMIREDYRARVAECINTASINNVHQLTFPLYVGNNVIWMYSRFKRSDSSGKTTGIMSSVDRPENTKAEELTIETVKNLTHQLNGISKSLFSFLQSENLDNTVNHILASLVTHFSAERAYIFEYCWEEMNQSCIYEAVSRPGLEEIHNLEKMFFIPETYWNQQILSQKPIILSTLDDLPDWDHVDREVLEAQDIKSLMAVPFISQDNKIWGYAGIDVVDKQRDWSEEDFQWFSSLMHIINICIELGKTKTQIQKDKEYLQKLYQLMPIGYIATQMVYDGDTPADFIITDVNKEVEHLSEQSAANIIGRKVSETTSFGDLPLMFKLVNTDQRIDTDYSIPHLNKHCRVIAFSLQKDVVISLILDITDSFNAHKELEEREKLLSTIYDSLPVGLELYDKEGSLMYANDKDLQILELDRKDDFLGVNVFEHPCLPANIKKSLKKFKEADFSLNYDFSILGNYYRKTFPQINVKNLTIKIVPILDKQQAVQNYLAIVINNTETTNAYLRIQEFEDYFSLIANLAKIGYFKWNLSTKEGFAISQWFMNLGKPANSVMTDNLADIYGNLHPDDFKEICDFYDKAEKGKAQSFEREIRMINTEGGIKWLRCTLIVKADSSFHNKELIGVSYDITELKDMILAKDKAEALDRLKSAFLANMSHEIRTPLNSIIGFSDLLAETDDEGERKEFIAIIQRNNELLLKLVSDILDLSKIESGTFDYVNKEVSTKKLCEEIMLSFGTKEMNGNVKLILDEDTPDLTMFVDSGRVKQVLMNFITNSIKFTHQGQIKLGYEQMPGDFVKFYVSDTGTGISLENIDRVFDRFVKLDSFVQGTGLGLAICRSLIEQMGGNIGVESESGKGSNFWFALPRVGIQPTKE